MTPEVVQSPGMDRSERSRREVLAHEVASDWGIALGPAFELSRYSYVAPAGPDMVLKLGSPEDDESLQEADALALWAGDGAVRLLRSDPSRRALLLERARPGSDLAALEPVAATTVAVAVARRLWRPAAAPFRWAGDHIPRWLAEATPRSPGGRRLLARARALSSRFEVDRSTLIHGDLHHHNILRAGAGYVAIDPKPMLGEPEFDVGPFLWNPLGSKMNRAETERRLATFAAAGLDQTRMRAWALIRGAYLCVGDGFGEPVVEILEAIQSR
jgi:streptomycin 6-kinase